VNGLRNALYERIETLSRDVSTLNRTFTEYANLSNDDTEQLYKSTATLREENAELRERVAMLETRMRETQNILRTVSMETTTMQEALLPNVHDFGHDVSQVIGQPDYRAPERLCLAPDKRDS
jgi:regulator of replication initiation timing